MFKAKSSVNKNFGGTASEYPHPVATVLVPSDCIYHHNLQSEPQWLVVEWRGVWCGNLWTMSKLNHVLRENRSTLQR